VAVYRKAKRDPIEPGSAGPDASSKFGPADIGCLAAVSVETGAVETDAVDTGAAAETDALGFGSPNLDPDVPDLPAFDPRDLNSGIRIFEARILISRAAGEAAAQRSSNHSSQSRVIV
jgi:hypothetical protein